MFSVVKGALHSAPVKGLIIDVMDFGGGNYGYRLYRDNVEGFSEDQKVAIFEWIKERADVAANLGNCQVGVDISDKPA